MPVQIKLFYSILSIHDLLLATTTKLSLIFPFILICYSSFQRNLLLYGTTFVGPVLTTFLIIDSTKVDDDWQSLSPRPSQVFDF